MLSTLALADDFPESFEKKEVNFERTNIATYKWWFWNVFDAALYLESGRDVSRYSEEDMPVTLSLKFRRGIKRGILVQASRTVLRDIYNAATLKRFQPSLDQIHEAYRSVKKGDVYALTYIPGAGIELILNGVSQTVINDDVFAEFYLSIWLSEHGRDGGLSTALLAEK